MASMTSMSIALSGLRAAQSNLAITGHNISNSPVNGYTRQQAIQQDYSYRNLGASPVGSLKYQTGLGTSIAQIRQIRNKFYDIAYREENSSGHFYSRKYNAGDEINKIIGELQSDYKPQDAINGVWVALNEVSKDPGAIETRTTFIQSTVTFLNKMGDINQKLFEYQLNLNEQVKQEVEKINNIVSQIADLNMQIEEAEANGNRANDFRDERNNLLDELSGFLDIEVKETPLTTGHGSRIDILLNGQELLMSNIQNKIGLKYSNGEYPFYEPVFTNSTEILPANSNATKLFPNLATEDLGKDSASAKGSLKGLLVARGDVIGNYTMPDADVKNFLIPKVQKKIDALVHEVVILLNNAVTQQGATDLNGNPGIPIFVRKSGAQGAENPADYATLFTLNNLEINPELLETDGYNKLAFSLTGDVGDTTMLNQLITDWKKPFAALENSSIDGYYKKIITDFGVEIQESREKLDSKVGSIDLAENKRHSLSSVSLDEELSNMLKFQHAYNSAAKVVNVIDSMLDKIINGTGRVGL